MQKIALVIDGSVSPLLERMDPGGWVRTIFSVGSVEFGVLAHPGLETLRAGAVSRPIICANGDHILWCGLPLPLSRALGVTSAQDAVNVAQRLDGAYICLAWDAASQVLHVVTDLIGLQPLYQGSVNGSIALASDMKAFPYDPDPAGWGSFMRTGNMMGPETLNRHARRLQGRHVYGFATDGSSQSRAYWNWPDQRGSEPDPRAVIEALDQNVAAYAKEVDASICLMSGGYDSRLIAGRLAKLAIPAEALIVSHIDEICDLDGRIAESVARQLGLPASRHVPETDFFSSRAYLDYIVSIDGVFPSQGLFIASVAEGLKPAVPVWEGLLPGLTLKDAKITEAGTFADYRAVKVLEDLAEWSIFTDAARAGFADAHDDAFARSTTNYSDDTVGTYQWMVDYRFRFRPASNPMQAFSAHTLPLMAGASHDFWNLVSTGPTEQRRGFRYMDHLFETTLPELTNRPFLSGGKIFGGPSAKWGAKRAHLEQVLFRAAGRRPRLARLAGLHTTGFARSRFFDTPALWEEEDPMLDMDRLRSVRAKGKLDPALAKLLFHWRAVRWLHEGRLHKMFGFG